MRSALSIPYYWLLSVFYGLWAALAALAPGRDAVTFVLRLYSKRMLATLDALAGVKVQLKGLENLPAGPCIIAAKHHSWGDGFVMFANVDNLSFVTGDHLEKFPLVGAILKKFGAIVVDSCGGPEARAALSKSAAQVAAEGRRILIYPEGHLAAPGERFRYRSGVYFMSKDFDLPVVPVATNLGCFWRQTEKNKTPGTATVEFLPALPQGLEKDDFMARMEAAIEGRTNALIAQARGEPVRPAVLVEWNGRSNVATEAEPAAVKA